MQKNQNQKPQNQNKNQKQKSDKLVGLDCFFESHHWTEPEDLVFCDTKLIHISDNCQRLAFFVFLRAYLDAVQPANGQDSRKNKREARQWLLSDSQEIGSFFYYCEMFSPNPDKFIAKVRRQFWQNKKINNKFGYFAHVA